MSKKTKNIIIFTSVIVIILLLAGGFWYLQKIKKPGQNFSDVFFDFNFPEFDNFLSNSSGTNTEGGLPDKESQRSLFTQISNTATAGAVFFKKTIEGTDATSTPVVRFIERSTGYIYETDLNTMKQTRITNTTIPRVYDAIWSKDGKNIILRYLDEDGQTIKTFIGEVIDGIDGEDGSLSGEFMQNNITNIITSPDKENIYYLHEINNEDVGIVADINGKNKKNVFEFPFLEWLPQWSESGIYLSTKPSYNTDGYLYKLNTRNGSIKKIIGDINGLTTLVGNTGEKLIYSENTKNSISSYIYDITTKESNYTPLNTIPEKCVWNRKDIKIYCAVPVSPDEENYPDSWYQGKTSFDDLLWVLYAKDNTIDIIGDPFEKTGNEMDMIKMFLSDDEQYLFFTNKKDMTVWMVDLSVYENSIKEPEKTEPTAQ